MSRIRDHFRSHRLSFWLNLIPRFMAEQYAHRDDNQPAEQTAVEYERYGRWMGEGAVRAAFVLGAVGVLSLVLRLAQWVETRRRL